MKPKFGPSRSDLIFRLWVSLLGIALTVFALMFRGIPTTPGGWEAILLASVFFGLTLIFTVRKLARGSYVAETD